MEFTNNNIPKITTRETEPDRSLYPNLSYLEAGKIAEWMGERKEQLLVQALIAENEADAARVLGLVAAGVGTICYAVNPFMLIGGMIGGAAWLWFVVDHHARTKEIAPLPFVRGNFLDAIARAGDYDARQNYRTDHFAHTIKFLPRHDAQEYSFLYGDFFETVVEYLTQIEPGKRFYAYRWLLDWYRKLEGRSLPGKQQLTDHLQNVEVDTRTRIQEVTAIKEALPPRFVELPKPNIVELPKSNILDYDPSAQSGNKLIGSNTKLNAINVPASPVDDKNTEVVEFKSEIPDLPALLAQSLKLTLIVGVPGSGKGIFVTNALEAVKQYHPNTTVFYIDPKNDPKETAYFSGRVDKLFRKDLMTTSPDDAAEWVANCLDEYDRFDCGHGRKLLVFDELTLTLKTLGAVKVEKGMSSPLTWLKRKLSGYSTSGDSRGIIFWGLSQNAHVSGLGMDGGDRTMFIPIFIIDARNVSASEGILKAQMIPGDKRLNSTQIEQLCEKSEIKRAIYFGGANQWYPMPRLENYSGFDRDNRKFLPGFTPLTKEEKLVVDYDIVMNLENSFKLDSDKISNSPEVEPIKDSEHKESSGFDFNKALEILRTLKEKGWIKFGDARTNSKPLRKVTRDAEDVRLIVGFLQKDGEAQIKDGEFFRIINKPS